MNTYTVYWIEREVATIIEQNGEIYTVKERTNDR